MMKTPRTIIFHLLILVMLLAHPLARVQAAGPTGTEVLLTQSDANAIRFTVNVGWETLSLEPAITDEGSFLSVALPDASSTDEVGAPQLPVIGRMVAVPFGVELELTVIPGKSQTRQVSEPVQPVPEQVSEGQMPNDRNRPMGLPDFHSRYNIDPAYYKNAAVYPGLLGKIANEGVLRQQRVVGIALYPVQYNPIKGELTIYESFEVALTFRGTVQPAKRSTAPESPAYEVYYSEALLNYESARGWRLDASSQNELLGASSQAFGTASQPWSPPNPGWRIKVRTEGIYQLTYAALASAGVDVEHLDPRTFHMEYLGQEIAIQVIGEQDGSFDLGDSVIFYGQALEDKYTQDNVYWLTYGGANGLRMQTRQVAAPSVPVAPWYKERMPLEENNWYNPSISGEDNLERFLWAGILASAGASGPAFTYSFNLTSPTSAAGQLDLDLVGQSPHTQGYKAVIALNGAQLGVLEWAGLTWAHFSATVPAGKLTSGNNTLTIFLDNTAGTIYDYVYLDRGELTYDSNFQARDDRLTFSYTLDQPIGFNLQGFSTAALRLFDIRDPNSPVSLWGFRTWPSGLTYNLYFQENSSVGGEHRYWAAALNTYLNPYAIEAASSSDLLSTAHGADYLVISHPDFLPQAQTLAAHRSGQGLRALAVNLFDIYDQFNYGIAGRDPIRAFLQYAYFNWQAPAPAYVVLLGDGHYNPKGFNPAAYGPWRESFIPPFLAFADPGLGETAADNRYAAVSGADNLPDMMLGRMAVTTAAQAEAFVNKIIAYESLPPNNDWGTPLLAVADNPDSGGNFPAISQAVIYSSYPDTFAVERVYLGTTHASVTAAREAILAAIDDGRFLVNYIGHAAQEQWSGYDNVPAFSGALLKYSDVAGLNNENKYPIISAMTCWEGYYINPNPVGSDYEALAEVITRATNKGAVASWSPTGTSVANGHDIINRAFFNAIFSSVLPTIGQAVQRSLLDLWATGTHLELADTFLLFGDPAMKFHRGLSAAADQYITNQETEIIVPQNEGVLSNDVNPEGLPLTAVLVSGPSNGLFTFSGDGSFSYLPNPNFSGIDHFAYKLFDGTRYSNTAVVTIVVRGTFRTYLPIIGK